MRVAIWIVTVLGLLPVAVLGALNVIISLQLAQKFERELEYGNLLKHVAFLRIGRAQIDFFPTLSGGLIALIGVAAIVASLILIRPH